ncbi:MAG TPA: hypothetical protein VL242_42945 [Sorangium sp.]|nr:hypothetical protein [Sorangium sp.]
MEGCDAQYDVSDLELSGTAEFRVNGTYVMTRTTSGSMTTIYPPQCRLTCEELDAAMKRPLAKT